MADPRDWVAGGRVPGGGAAGPGRDPAPPRADAVGLHCTVAVADGWRDWTATGEPSVRGRAVPYASRVAALTPADASRDTQRPTGATPVAAGARDTVQIGALLVAAALLRTGAVGAGAAVQLDLTDLGGQHPSSIVVGLVGAAQAAPEMIFAFALARIADRVGRSRFLIGGPLLGVIGCLCVAGAVHPGQIAAARLIEGVGAAAFVPTALGTIAAATAGDRTIRARASGAFEGATLFGYAGGFLLGGFTYHALHRAAFVVLAVFYLGASLVCLRFVPRVPPLRVSPLPVVLRAITGPGPIRAFIPAWLAVNALVGAWYFNVASLLKRAEDPSQTLIHGFDERLISLFLDGFVVLLLIGIVLWTPVLRRLGGARTMRLAVPGAYLTCLGFLIINHAPLRLAPALLPIAVIGIVVEAGFGPAAVAYLADCSENLAADRSALMAFYTVTLAGGGAVGAVLGGIAARIGLFDGLIGLGLILTTVAVVSLNGVIRYERRREAAAAVSGGAPVLR